jgi:hypothetical protein
MANIAAVTGVQGILKNLKARNAALAAGVSRGLRLAGLHLQRESQRVVPVDLGNLKASAFTRATGKGYDTVVNIGYTATYAIFVHENVEMKWKGLPRHAPSKGRYWDPQGRGQAKFLEEPARRLGPELRAIIRAHSKVMGI